jgi:predicted nucleic acid-binding protein
VISALFDTNILIDALNGYQEPVTEFSFWATPLISAITLIELHAGASLNMKQQVASLIAQNGFAVIQTDDTIVAIAARIRSASVRQRAKIALADAIILATAQAHGLMVVTRNKKDFKGPNIRIPYELETVTSTRVINVRPPPRP